ncbi:hypothetical protein GGF46_004402 [Coemansia sp. RSA 552]|nr:hypothetical protein GGF46_004402 [Coemansia sp. RSA 552]
MAKLTAQEKEKAKQAQGIEARLRASANAASQVVSGWLDSDESDQEDPASAAPKARQVFQGRPARLGVGAKFLSHSEMQRNSSSGIGLSAQEMALKRKLTRGPKEDRDRAKSSEQDGHDDDETDSRSKSVAKAPGPTHSPPAAPSPAKKRPKKTKALLDSLIPQRRR